MQVVKVIKKYLTFNNISFEEEGEKIIFYRDDFNDDESVKNYIYDILPVWFEYHPPPNFTRSVVPPDVFQKKILDGCSKWYNTLHYKNCRWDEDRYIMPFEYAYEFFRDDFCFEFNWLTKPLKLSSKDEVIKILGEYNQSEINMVINGNNTLHKARICIKTIFKFVKTNVHIINNDVNLCSLVKNNLFNLMGTRMEFFDDYNSIFCKSCDQKITLTPAKVCTKCAYDKILTVTYKTNTHPFFKIENRDVLKIASEYLN